MEINDKPLMASEIIGALGQPKEPLHILKVDLLQRARLEKLNLCLLMHRSLRSLISIDHAGEASMSKPHVLLEMMKTAIPPFKNMFIEWDEHYRVHL